MARLVRGISALQCIPSSINPSAEEASKLSKRKVDTSDEYLKWTFSKLERTKGLYSEYKAVSTENTLVIYCGSGNFCVMKLHNIMTTF